MTETTLRSYLFLVAALLVASAAVACNYPFEVREVESVCTGGLDEDGDGLTDCQDDDCSDDEACFSEDVCDDEQDNDGDGQTDCEDPDCEQAGVCIPDEDCTNGLDDDLDGQTDCDDTDCLGEAVCVPETECENDIDDDLDGETDCDDPDCADALPCLGPRPCNNDGICDSFEERLWCDDCCPSCSMTEGDAYDYIATEVIIPTNATEADQIGVDMDGDGVIDNALGGLVGIFPTSSSNPNEDIAEAIVEGDYQLLGRLYVSSWPSDEAMAAQIFPGGPKDTLDATEDNLTGSGNVHIAFNADRDLHVCGDLVGGDLETCPGELELPFFFLDSLITIPMQHAQLISHGTVDASGWTDVMLGGGLTQQTIDSDFIPYLQTYLNQATIEDPSSTAGSFVLTFLDAECSNNHPGCEDVINDEGECATWDGDPNTPPLTLTELRCNSLVQGYLELDVDIDGDGTPDLLSFGVKVTTIPVNIIN
jgi:hypothetical protein